MRARSRLTITDSTIDSLCMESKSVGCWTDLDGCRVALELDDLTNKLLMPNTHAYIPASYKHLGSSDTHVSRMRT
eukprot:9647-Eustigmatos_ZCMA.PRE.1